MKHQAIYSFVPVVFFAFLVLFNAPEITGTGYFFVSPGDLTPKSSGCGFINWGASLDPEIECDFYSGNLQFPDGARITELKLFYKDTSDQDMVVQFAANHLDDSSDTLESVTTSGNYNVATSTAKPTSIYMPPIGTYSYFVHGLFQPNIRFYGLRIKFEYTIPWYALPMYLPIIMRGQN